MSKKIIESRKNVFLEKMKANLGNISQSCAELGIARDCYYRWLKEDPEFAQKMEDVIEESVDFAESCLKQQMRQGNTTAIIFYLKTRGKHRGYVESQKIIAEGGMHIDLPPIDLELVGGEDEKK